MPAKIDSHVILRVFDWCCCCCCCWCRCCCCCCCCCCCGCGCGCLLCVVLLLLLLLLWLLLSLLLLLLLLSLSLSLSLLLFFFFFFFFFRVWTKKTWTGFKTPWMTFQEFLGYQKHQHDMFFLVQSFEGPWHLRKKKSMWKWRVWTQTLIKQNMDLNVMWIKYPGNNALFVREIPQNYHTSYCFPKM